MKYSTIEIDNAVYSIKRNFVVNTAVSFVFSCETYNLYAIRFANEPNKLPNPPAFEPHNKACQFVVNFANNIVAGTLLII